MKRKIFAVVLLFIILLVTGCGKVGTQKKENKKELSKEEISLSNDGYTRSIDTSNFDLKCFDNIKYHFDDNIFISNDGTVCLVNYEKPFSLSKKNTLFIDEKLKGTVYGAIRNNNTYYFLTDKEMLKLDDNYNFVTVTDLAEMNNFGFRGSEAIGRIKKTSFDKIFFSEGLFYILKDNLLYRFSYDSAYENIGENGYGYNPYLDKYKIDSGTINEEIVDYMHSNFFGDIIVTNNGYYRKTLTNSDEINKYNDVQEKYEFVKLEINNYKEKIKFISPNYIVFDNAIYEFVPVELREN